jgi:hypothetical protein
MREEFDALGLNFAVQEQPVACKLRLSIVSPRPK